VSNEDALDELLELGRRLKELRGELATVEGKMREVAGTVAGRGEEPRTAPPPVRARATVAPRVAAAPAEDTGTDLTRIQQLLDGHPTKAYTPVEVVEELGVELTRLKSMRSLLDKMVRNGRLIRVGPSSFRSRRAKA